MPDSVPPLVTLVCRERVSLQLSAYTELGLRYFFRSISFLVQKKFLIHFVPTLNITIMLYVEDWFL